MDKFSARDKELLSFCVDYYIEVLTNILYDIRSEHILIDDSCFVDELDELAHVKGLINEELE